MAKGGHLLLSRRTSESIIIQGPDGKEIARVQLVEAGIGRARIGISADPSIKILREELVDNPMPRSSLVP